MQRYSGYSILPAQPVPPAVTGALVTDKLTSCSFVYVAGQSQRDALVTVRLDLTDTGETVSLIQQIHVNNVP